MRRVLIPLVAVAVVAAVVVGLTQTGGGGKESSKLTPAEMRAALNGAPKDLAAVYARANQLVGGSVRAFQSQVDALKGRPIVVNKWASWCGPCRVEFPLFQHAAVTYGKRVAFLGVNANDHDAAAAGFLRQVALPYPSFTDPRLAISAELGAVAFFPTTIFLGPDGSRAYIHQGQYREQSQLDADIRRYALKQS